ncbi:MAG: hypothetical protein ACRDHL_03440 [Candidatus Promineifilaceae bacterium]
MAALASLGAAGAQPGQRQWRWLGLLNGLAIGLALAAGVWALEAATLAELPMPMPYPHILSAAGLVVGLCVAAGWLSASLNRTAASLAIWLVAAGLAALIIGLTPTAGRNLFIRAADARFGGQAPYPPSDLAIFLALTTNFLVLGLLGLLALLQESRLEGMQETLSGRQWLSAAALIRLLMPLPFVFAAGWISSDFSGSRSGYQAIEIVDQAIRRVRDYDGNLFQLSRQEGTNYNALNALRGRLAGNYELLLGSTDPANSTTTVVAHFHNGAWIHCQLILNQLTFCGDAGQRYYIGFRALVRGRQPPQSCLGCQIRDAEAWQGWLAERRPALGDDPIISRQAQWGLTVILRAEAPDGGAAIECTIQGATPGRLRACWDTPA